MHCYFPAKHGAGSAIRFFAIHIASLRECFVPCRFYAMDFVLTDKSNGVVMQQASAIRRVSYAKRLLHGVFAMHSIAPPLSVFFRFQPILKHFLPHSFKKNEKPVDK